jgi:protein XRP2
MGCSSSSQNAPVQVSKNLPKTTKPSFGRDPNINVKDFMCSNRKGEVFIREPGSIKGQQFIIEDCDDCDIYLMDHSAQVNIDMCTNCRIFVGPCASSVFIRDCTGCSAVFAVQQLRTRGCKELNISLFSQTEPVIESSSKVKLTSFDFSYFELAGFNPLSTVNF